jgi:hypothetical protein
MFPHLFFQQERLMKKHQLLSILASSLLSANLIADDALSDRMMKLEKQLLEMQEQLQALKAENNKLSKELTNPVVAPTKNDSKLASEVEDLQEQVTKLSKNTNQNNLKWGVDFRTSVENLQYDMANGTTQKNDALFSNRLWLNMAYEPNSHVKFGGQLAYNKLFGQRSMINPQSGAMDAFDWVSSEDKQDDTLRVRSAFIDYKNDKFLGINVPWSVGIGRRPSTNGKLINYREDDDAMSPLAHITNAEFDGGNIK